MSYELVRGIKINEKKGEVFIKSTSNNVTPKIYNWWSSNYFKKLLKEKGKETVEIRILEEYISGNMQAGTKNKYYWSFISLLHNPEFKKFDWRNYGFDEEKREDYYKEKNKKEYIELLKNALKEGTPTDNYIISKISYRGDEIYGKQNKRSISWHYEKRKATKYKYRDMAERVMSNFRCNDWKIIKI